MTHLTDEQLEEILLGQIDSHEHLARCDRCAARLAEREAIQKRLRKSFQTVTAPADLGERLRARIQAARDDQAREREQTIHLAEKAPAPSPRGHVLRLRPWMGLSAAAAVLLVAGLIFLLPSGKPAIAARARLDEIYEECLCLCSLADNDEATFYHEDPAEVGRFLKGKAGVAPLLPDTGDRTVLLGGRVVKFLDQLAPAYVVEQGGDPIAIVAVPATPAELSLGHSYEHEGKRFWFCQSGACDLAAVRLGDRTYCVVGKVDREVLKKLSHQIAAKSPVPPPAWPGGE